MDPDRFRDAYQRLQSLDERLTHKLRLRSHATLSRVTHEQLEGRVRDLADYTLELKEVMDELFQAIAAAPPDGKAQQGP
jgi:hypothetical protein